MVCLWRIFLSTIGEILISAMYTGDLGTQTVSHRSSQVVTLVRFPIEASRSDIKIDNEELAFGSASWRPEPR